MPNYKEEKEEEEEEEEEEDEEERKRRRSSTPYPPWTMLQQSKGGWGAAELCLRSYHVENTGSRPITAVKQRRARLVLGWETASEHRVL